jgi:hypothetical protein
VSSILLIRDPVPSLKAKYKRALDMKGPAALHYEELSRAYTKEDIASWTLAEEAALLQRGKSLDIFVAQFEKGKPFTAAYASPHDPKSPHPGPDAGQAHTAGAPSQKH